MADAELLVDGYCIACAPSDVRDVILELRPAGTR